MLVTRRSPRVNKTRKHIVILVVFFFFSMTGEIATLMFVHMFQIMVKYRSTCGIEPIRRCGNCVGGEGDKLKRCGNCDEVYCSRECQVFAWELGHKTYCKK